MDDYRFFKLAPHGRPDSKLRLRSALFSSPRPVAVVHRREIRARSSSHTEPRGSADTSKKLKKIGPRVPQGKPKSDEGCPGDANIGRKGCPSEVQKNMSQTKTRHTGNKPSNLLQTISQHLNLWRNVGNIVRCFPHHFGDVFSI